MNELLVPLQALGLRGDFWREENESWTIAESSRCRADLASGLAPGPCPEGHWPQGSLAGSPAWEQESGEGGTCSLLPLWVQLLGEDGVFQLTEEPLQHVGDVLNEVVVDAQLDIAGVPPKLLHQYLDPGLGSVLAVNPLMPQPWGRDMGSWGPNLAQGIPNGAGAQRAVPPASTHWPLHACQRMLQPCRCRTGLTVLCDEGDAAVHDDGDVPPAQLLVPQRITPAPRRCLDVSVPCRRVCSRQALQVKCPENNKGRKEGMKVAGGGKLSPPAHVHSLAPGQGIRHGQAELRNILPQRETPGWGDLCKCLGHSPAVPVASPPWVWDQHQPTHECLCPWQPAEVAWFIPQSFLRPGLTSPSPPGSAAPSSLGSLQGEPDLHWGEK